MIYQEPMASLNPAMKVGRQLMEVPMIHAGASAAEARAQALRIVEAVRLPDPERILGSYPHQLSGGQQQRIVIAMALMSKPALLILDEPTTALDVTVEAGIVQLVKDLGREFGTSMLFISHNLGLVLETCDRLCVMYSGEAVETGPIAEVFDAMRHPYTQGLFRSIPLPGADRTRQPLVADPRPVSPAPRAPAGLQLRPALQLFRRRPLRRRRHPDGAGRRRPTPPAASAGTRSTGPRRPPPATPPPRRRSARSCSRVDGLRKYYAGRLQRPLRRRHPGGEGQRDPSASRPARPRPWPSSAKSAAASRRSPRCCSASRPPPPAPSPSAPPRSAHRRSSAATPAPSPRMQMVFQNPFDTLNPSMSIGGQIVRALEKFRVGSSDAERRGADARAARPRAAAPRLRRPHAAPALRRPEAAHRHRPRLRRRARGSSSPTSRSRPSTSRCRPRSPSSSTDIQREPPHDACCSSATTSASCAISPTG